jgi:hypothetical protein
MEVAVSLKRHERPADRSLRMSTGKHLSARGLKNGDARWGAVHPASEDDWSEPEKDATRIDARIEDRSDWARPREPGAVDHITKMLEEVLIAVPLSPIEDHRMSTDDRALGTPQPSRAPVERGRSMRFVLAGILGGMLAILVATWFLT